MRLLINSKTLENRESLSTVKIHFNGVVNIEKLAVSRVSLAFTWYNISTANNTLIINNKEINIRPQYYNINDLHNTLLIILQPFNIDVGFNFQTLKMRFSSKERFSINFKGLSYMLGFGFFGTERVYHGEESNGFTVESNGMCDVSNGSHSIIVTTNLANNMLYNNNVTNILESFPISSYFGSIIHYNARYLTWFNVNAPVQTLELQFHTNMNDPVDILSNNTEIEIIIEEFNPIKIPRIQGGESVLLSAGESDASRRDAKIVDSFEIV